MRESRYSTREPYHHESGASRSSGYAVVLYTASTPAGSGSSIARYRHSGEPATVRRTGQHVARLGGSGKRLLTIDDAALDGDRCEDGVLAREGEFATLPLS